MNTADLLTSYETCDRKGHWSYDWQRRRLDPTTVLYEGIRAGLTENARDDYGNVAGERVMELAVDPGMEMPVSRYLHESVIHHATASDIITSAIRKPRTAPWGVPGPPVGADWTPSAFLSQEGHLRAITLATSWSDARHWAMVRSWRALGEVAMYGFPMTMVVVILGAHRDGRRNGPWTKGFLHPQNHKLRFRKKTKVTHETFSDKWQAVWREDRDEIETKVWLQAMLEDDILRDVLFTVEIPVPEKPEVQRIRDMADKKLERLAKLASRANLPEASLSVCDRPPCPFKGCCWSAKPYEPKDSSAFARITT